jgi:DNA-binding helix-hairpin-helix protein with protein kinase domain
MKKVYNNRKRSISLLREISKGGEGFIWETDIPGYVAKLYKSPDPVRMKKIEVMVANPPSNPTAILNHTAFAWPTEILRDERGNFLGFLMPKIQEGVHLMFVCNPKLRKKAQPQFNWKYLHTTAKNLAWIVHTIHAEGYILGDLKQENVLVNDRALVSIVDTDSFQVRDPEDGTLYRCNVGSQGYTPPELLNKDIPDIAQTRAHDLFRLGIIIHYLLFGQHPFEGEWSGLGDIPAAEECIRNGWWPYAPNSLIRASHRTIPLDIVHPCLKECFIECFNDGHKNINLRPTAKKWYESIELAIQGLKTCSQVPNHVYSTNYKLIYGRCYWCDRARNLGVDIFDGSPSSTKSLSVNPAPTPIPIPTPISASSQSSNSTLSPATVAISCLIAIVIVVVFIVILL